MPLLLMIVPSIACSHAASGFLLQVARAGRQHQQDDGLLLYIDENGAQSQARYGNWRLAGEKGGNAGGPARRLLQALGTGAWCWVPLAALDSEPMPVHAEAVPVHGLLG